MCEDAVLFGEQVSVDNLAYLADGSFPYAAEVGCEWGVHVPSFPFELPVVLNFCDDTIGYYRFLLG